MKGRAVLLCLFSILIPLLFVFGVVAGAGHSQLEHTSPPDVSEITIGLVVDEAGITDPLNRSCYEGLMRAQSELGVTGTVYTPTNSGEYTATLQGCVDGGNTLCIASSWILNEATIAIANANPEQDFAIVSSIDDRHPDNLRGTEFARDQAGYLAGVLAGLMSESNVVGDIGAMPMPSVDQLVYGFRNGAQCAKPEASVLVKYAGSFVDAPLGATIAQEMIGAGADVIFAPAGYTAYGAVLTATQSGAWAIGVDLDFYETVFGGGTVPGADKLLSSAITRFDVVVFETISDTVHGAFSGDPVIYGLEVDAVGLAAFHEADPAVPQSVRLALEETRLGIIDGMVDVHEDCREYMYLALISGGG